MTVQWLGYTDNIGSITTVHSAVSRTGNSIHWITDEKELRNALANGESAVVWLKSGIGYNVYELCRDLTLTFPLVSVVLLVPSDELNFKKAMHAGAVDAVGLPGTESEIVQAARDVEESLRIKTNRLTGELPQDQKNGRVLTVYGTKGGIGKTTLAVNLAVALSKSDLRVAVLDLDLQFGDVAIFFDVQPKRTIYEWVKEEQDQYSGEIDRYMIRHASGVEMLAAPLRPEFAEVIGGEHVGLIIGKLKRAYDIVIIDTPPSLMETSLVALENSQDILMVASMDLPTLKNSKLGIETLESLGMKDRMKVVLNRDSKVEGIRLDMVENIIGMPIFARIPSEGKVVVTSVNRGVPFVLSNPREAVTRSIFSIASKLQNDLRRGQTVPRHVTKPLQKSLFKSIFKR